MLTILCRNGQLKEYLAAGVTKEDFMRRMGVVLDSRGAEPVTTQNSQSPVSTTAANESAPAPVSEQPLSTAPETTASSSSQQPDASSTPRRHQSPAELLAERNARLKKQLEDQAKESKNKGKAPAKSKAEGQGPAKALPSSADMKYAQMQKKRQQDARDERNRISKRVEDDKAQRRQDAEARRAKVKADATSNSQVPATGASSSNHLSTKSTECAVQVRLFDGSTIRSKFPSQGNLRTHLRPWIDEKQEGDQPYTFKQVLTPVPNKNISISEEEESLQTLGLTPSATLILMAVDGYTSAYEGGGATGLVYRGASAGYNLVSSSVGLVTGVVGSIFGGGAAAPTQDEPQHPPPATTPSASINVRTLRDQQRSEDQQFYNGNAVSTMHMTFKTE